SGGLHLLLLEYFVSYLLMTPVLALMWGYASTTPGKWVMRLRIVDAQTLGKMSGRQMILRLAGYFIAIFPLGAGILWIACDKKKRGWQDYFASTAVIRVKHWRIRDDGVTPHLMDETAETPADISQDKAEQP
ncbi:MAG: RDD family protein, partial [Rickettsiales bacterium]|nr:RDD family protein [Rickettsiales bacterium]